MADLKAATEFLDQYSAAINAVVEAVAGAVVRVERTGQGNGHNGHRRWRQGRARTNHGSGVVIDAEKGHILTSYHVVSGTQDVEIQLGNGRQIRAKRIGKDPENDLALLKVEGESLAALKLGDSNTLKP